MNILKKCLVYSALAHTALGASENRLCSLNTKAGYRADALQFKALGTLAPHYPDVTTHIGLQEKHMNSVHLESTLTAQYSDWFITAQGAVAGIVGTGRPAYAQQITNDIDTSTCLCSTKGHFFDAMLTTGLECLIPKTCSAILALPTIGFAYDEQAITHTTNYKQATKNRWRGPLFGVTLQRLSPTLNLQATYYYHLVKYTWNYHTPSQYACLNTPYNGRGTTLILELSKTYNTFCDISLSGIYKDFNAHKGCGKWTSEKTIFTAVFNRGNCTRWRSLQALLGITFFF